MQKAVFEYNIDEALKLLENGNVESVNFGTINEYDDYELEEYCKGMLKIHKIYGLRISRPRGSSAQGTPAISISMELWC